MNTQNKILPIKEDQIKWWLLFATSLVLIMTNIDLSAVNLALAPIANDLHTNLTTLQWIINGYSSAAAAFVLIGGRLGDIYGYRRIFVIGVAVFTITSLLIGFAIGKWDIIIFRIIQGAGGSMCWPLCVVIVSNAFPENQQGYAIAMSMAVASVAMAVGPIFGGILLHFLSWRWIFFINLPFGILAALLGLWFIPNLTQTKHLSLHIPSALLLIISIFSITTALNEVQQWGFSSILFQLLFWSGIILFAIFIWQQRIINNPVLNLKLLNHRTLKICLLLRVFNQFILVSILFILGLLLQNILNYSSLTSGYILLPLTIALSITLFTGGRFIDKYGSRNLIIIGMGLSFIATLWLALNNTINVITFILPLIIAGIGLGINIPSLITAILKNTAPENRGVIGGINYATLFIGGGFATVISGWILQAQSAFKINELLTSITLNTAQVNNLKSILTGTRSIQYLSEINLIPWIQQSFIHAFSIAMWLCAALSFISLLCVLKMKR